MWTVERRVAKKDKSSVASKAAKRALQMADQRVAKMAQMKDAE